jgi:hypothetical protein
MPSEQEVKKAIELYLGGAKEAQDWAEVLALAFRGLSYADIERDLLRVRRQAVLQRQAVIVPLRHIVQERVRDLDREHRTALSLELIRRGLSQRETHEWTGVSRDTIRKAGSK